MSNSLHGPAGATGFTLVELLAGMAVTAILATLAASGFRTQLAQAALAASTGRALSALHWARQTALTTGSTVTVCPSEDGISCGFGAQQWIAFANRAGGSQARREADEPLLQTWQMPGSVTVTGTRGYASFQPRIGAASTVTFVFCHPALPHRQRQVIVSQTGRPRLELPAAASSAARPACLR